MKKRSSITNSSPKIGRNDSCPCGSNKKYKKCCLIKEMVRVKAMDIAVDETTKMDHVHTESCSHTHVHTKECNHGHASKADSQSTAK